MTKIVSVARMREVEQEANAAGLSLGEMMANAGHSVAAAVRRAYPEVQNSRVAILVGSGNNGGDGLVAGDHLREWGAQVGVYLVGDRPQDDPLLEPYRQHGLLVAEAKHDQRFRVLTNMIESAEVVIDAIFGTGVRLPLGGQAAAVLERVNAVLARRDEAPFVVAVDCPSGLDCDSGEIDEHVLAAELTVTLAASKPGLYRFPGADYVGEVEVGSIGLSNSNQALDAAELDLATVDVVARFLPERARNSHKGSFGRVVIVAGSINLPGAAVLAGRGAYRVGAGLVTLAVPSMIHQGLISQLPEATWILLPNEMGQLSEDAFEVLAGELNPGDIVVVGPGLGRDDPPSEFLAEMLGAGVSGHRGSLGFLPRGSSGGKERLTLDGMVLDADALTLLPRIDSWHARLPETSVLTPHPGEMATLTGASVDDIQADRVGTASKWASEWGHVVVLKGAFTVIAEPGGRSTLIPFATSALATAGTGDVLAGAIGGLRAQGVAAYEAAVAAAYLHGMAGEIAAAYLGSDAAVMAGDVAEAVADAIAALENRV